jgi:hypothetical protein
MGETSVLSPCLAPNTVQLRGISVGQTIVLCRLPGRKNGSVENGVQIDENT